MFRLKARTLDIEGAVRPSLQKTSTISHLPFCYLGAFGMSGELRRHWQRFAGALLIAFLSPAAAQDIRGLEVCTAEKQMERRTGCLQANIEFLQQALTRLTRETQDKIATIGRDLGAAQAEIASLKSTIAKLNGELAQLKVQLKVEPRGEKK
jgi:septal ring factor EnvC (AmiA/AmiB activator)